MKESSFTKKVLPKWQKKHPQARVMRNNTGAAYQGKLLTFSKNGIAEKILKNIRLIFFGIGLAVKDKKTGRAKQKGGGDYIGWESKRLCDIISKDKITIPQCMQVCEGCQLNQKIAIFLNLEIKSKNGKETTEQIKFRKMVIAAGGISEILQEGKDDINNT